MFVVTPHDGFLSLDQGKLVQTDSTGKALQRPCFHELVEALKQVVPDANIVELEKPYFHIMSGNCYLSVKHDGTISFDNKVAEELEIFRFVDGKYIWALCNGDRERFAKVVSAANRRNEPVKLHMACGWDPIPGFLNVDIYEWASEFARSRPGEYFIFPSVGTRMPIADNSVDFIFHEDFIEHIGQLDQITFLAEMLRVLKPGAVHRVNTPNLLWTMRTRSNFALGSKGVYRGERQWEHVLLFSPGHLEEVARMVGYSEVHFNGRGESISSHAIPDRRPFADRDAVLGNIYADLVK